MSDITSYFIVNTEAAIHKKGKWLVGVRSKNESEAAGLLSFVGGKVEHFDSRNDTLECAIVREVEEEINIRIKVLNFVNNSSFISKKGTFILNVVFLCEIETGEPKISDTREMESLHWLTTEEIINYPNSPVWICESVTRADSLVKSY